MWSSLSTKQKGEAKREWEQKRPILEAARAERGFQHVPADDNEYLSIINSARDTLAPHEPPAMPCIGYACYAGRPLF